MGLLAQDMRGYRDMPPNLLPSTDRESTGGAYQKHVPCSPNGTWGQRIKRIRDAGNLTQRQLATDIGVRPGTIGDWERGITTVPLGGLPDDVFQRLVAIEDYWVYQRVSAQDA